MDTEEKKNVKRYKSAMDCPITNMIDVIGGKWKPVIIWILLQQTTRFGELRRQIPGISIKVLSRQLKELETDGIVQKKIFAEVPPRVDYSLTERGRTLTGVMNSLADWSRHHIAVG